MEELIRNEVIRMARLLDKAETLVQELKAVLVEIHDSYVTRDVIKALEHTMRKEEHDGKPF